MKLAIVLGLLLCAVSAKADSFVLTGRVDAMQLASLPSSVVCPCGSMVESFNTTFDYDTASQSVSNMTFNSTGLLGTFTFTGAAYNGVTANTDFTWSSPLANIIFNVYDHTFTDPSLFAPDHSLVLLCLTTDCVGDFGSLSPTWLNDLSTQPKLSTLDPSTPTPEPSSITLLLSGVISLAFMRKLIVLAR